MAQCPECGSVASDPRAAFCEQCGANLRDSRVSSQREHNDNGAAGERGDAVPSGAAGDGANSAIPNGTCTPSTPVGPGPFGPSAYAVPEQQSASIPTDRVADSRAADHGSLSGADPRVAQGGGGNVRAGLGDSADRAEGAEEQGRGRIKQRGLGFDTTYSSGNGTRQGAAQRTREDAGQVQGHEATEAPASSGLWLYVNSNRLYMEGYIGIIDIKVENRTSEVFDCLRIELSGQLLERGECVSLRLSPGESKRRRFQVRPTFSGIALLQFRVSCQLGDSVVAFWAETDLPVFEKTQELRDISVQADKLLEIGAGRDNAKNMGNSIKVHIDSLVKQDKIRTANDFIADYSKQPPVFSALALELDPERSRQLTDSLAQPDAQKRVLQAERGSVAEVASLRVMHSDRPINILLLAQSRVTLGRGRNNDIITRVAPRSDENDALTMRLSRMAHCRIDLGTDGVSVRDENSRGKSLLDDKAVDTTGTHIVEGRQQLDLGKALRLKIRCLNERAGLPEVGIYERIIGHPLGPMWHTATQAGINAVNLERVGNLDHQDVNGCESYVLVYRVATIGSDEGCAICFADQGLKPVHVAILYCGLYFYLENLADGRDVIVNNTVISKSELIPLSIDDDVKIARLEMQFTQGSQILIPSSAGA